MRADALVLAAIGLWGAAGVACLATGAHADPSGLLGVAGQFLLFHASAAAALFAQPVIAAPRRLWPQTLLLLGSGLFAAALSAHAVLGLAQARFLAPVGGALTIIAWLSIVALALSSPGARR